MKKKTLLTSALAVASVSSLLAFYPIANAQDAADSKLNLRTNSLLRMPSNIPQEHIYDSGISIPYPEDGVKGVYLQAFRAKGQDLENMIQFVNRELLFMSIIQMLLGLTQVSSIKSSINKLN